MSQSEVSRLDLELELLQAMYPEQVEFTPRSRDFKFSDHHALLHLRLPDQYPESALPDLLSTSDASKRDVRNQMKAAIQSLELTPGEEALDAIIACFQSIITETNTDDSPTNAGNPTKDDSIATESSKTVIIWLHHLLALSKRKLALSPALSLSGITKPGYPGVMVFTGPTPAVNEHVNTLKAEKWQAFQVRYEGGESWEFAHGTTVTEVETMAEVVKAIEVGQDGARRKREFLEAVGIK
ncbi:hypothetical protein CC78DRAFT_13000 [Lojkania enalia]|uniref:RWD domain-containing protein n=1 Tax=Lojkania enalia TaxID=147567 RepID=A0A9P4NDC0_9PLEO|nr:hypothetical protein CC78DRAFT_13000 [Didymosphaeria enalia]